LRNGAKFEDLAARFSKGLSRESGGDIGYFTHEELASSIEDEVWGLKVGTFSEVIPTQDGFVILKVTERR
jgi:parvulin-like peptidyl-prolyl isomerase